MSSSSLILTLLFLFVSGTVAVDMRLSQKIVPISYKLSIRPNLQEATFKGTVKIKFLNAGYYDSIKIHSVDLKIETMICTQGTTKIEIDKWTEWNHEITLINFTDELLKGTYWLEITYSGSIRNDMSGFYLSSYFDNHGNKKLLGVTQFQPNWARRAFPCFDEPNLKANFELVMFLEGNAYDVISNTKISIHRTGCSDCNAKGAHFERYPRMSTYLLAWLIYDKGTFLATPRLNRDGIVYRVLAQQRYYDLMNASNIIAAKLISKMTEYTEVPYLIEDTINKMDQVAVPDFEAGAMENWGLVLYRETLLLFDRQLSMTSDYTFVVLIIGHEFGHQWFGNRITTAWWSATWLNEAFANYFEFHLPAMVYPDWQLDQVFLVKSFQVGLGRDHKFAHPMTCEFYTNHLIKSMFDTITYEKGGSVLRMLEFILTPESFRKGLSQYLKVMSKYKPEVEPIDFFKMMSIVQDPEQKKVAPVEHFMESWTKHAGYPVITVRVDHTNKVIHLHQEIFIKKSAKANKNKLKNLMHETFWYVPLSYTTKEKKEFKNVEVAKWLTPELSETTIPVDFDKTSWVIFNVNAKGFFRVMYDTASFQLIVDQLMQDPNEIGVFNRSQFINDTYALAENGYLTYSDFFNVIQYLKKETEYIPWYSALEALGEIEDQLRGTETHKKLRTLLLDILEPQLSHLGFVPSLSDSSLYLQKRALLLAFAATLDHPETLRKAKEIVSNLAATKTTDVHPDVVSPLLCAGIRQVDGNAWKNLFELLKSPECPTRVSDFQPALACTKDAASIHTYLDYYFHKKDLLVIRPQDEEMFKYMLLKTETGGEEAMKYLKTNYQAVLNANKKNEEIICEFIRTVSMKMYKQSQNDAVNALLTELNKAGIKGCVSLYKRAEAERKSFESSISPCFRGSP